MRDGAVSAIPVQEREGRGKDHVRRLRAACAAPSPSHGRVVQLEPSSLVVAVTASALERQPKTGKTRSKECPPSLTQIKQLGDYCPLWEPCPSSAQSLPFPPHGADWGPLAGMFQDHGWITSLGSWWPPWWPYTVLEGCWRVTC